MTIYRIPVGNSVDVLVVGDFPLTAVGWGQMMRVLDAMRPALVGDDRSDPRLRVGNDAEQEGALRALSAIELLPDGRQRDGSPPEGGEASSQAVDPPAPVEKSLPPKPPKPAPARPTLLAPAPVRPEGATRGSIFCARCGTYVELSPIDLLQPMPSASALSAHRGDGGCRRL